MGQQRTSTDRQLVGTQGFGDENTYVEMLYSRYVYISLLLSNSIRLDLT